MIDTEATATIKSSTVTGQAAHPATDYLSFCSNLKCTEGRERYSIQFNSIQFVGTAACEGQVVPKNMICDLPRA